MSSRRLFDGAQSEIGSLPIVAAVAAGITADVDVTLGDATLSADATLSSPPIAADLSATLANATLSADATVVFQPIAGDLSQTLGAATLSADATITQPSITASLSVTLDAATLAATGQIGPIEIEAGGGASAGRRGRLRGEGWGRERAILEASLQRIAQQDVRSIAQTMADSERPQAQRIARKLADYTGETAQVESLRRELAKLELAQRERVAGEQLQAQREADLQAAAQELRAILREDEEVVEIMGMLQDLERKQVLGVLGLTIH